LIKLPSSSPISVVIQRQLSGEIERLEGNAMHSTP